MQQHCVACHTQGGVGPFALETYEEVTLVKARLAQAVAQGTMPPWPPDESGTCPPLQGSRRLSAAGGSRLDRNRPT